MEEYLPFVSLAACKNRQNLLQSWILKEAQITHQKLKSVKFQNAKETRVLKLVDWWKFYSGRDQRVLFVFVSPMFEKQEALSKCLWKGKGKGGKGRGPFVCKVA